jgi:transcription initiation factor TFIIF subunit alpha
LQSEEESNPELEEEKRDGKPSEQAKLNGDKSGASTKGENTPSDRKKNIKGTKRPGSPNLSEASGNESTRKKAKLNSIKRAADVEASGASGNESSYKNKKLLSKATRGPPQSLNALGLGRSGSGSESESVRRSRLDLSARGTPAGSRAQSPLRSAGGTSKANTRASSPDATGSSKGGAGEGAVKARGKHNRAFWKHDRANDAQEDCRVMRRFLPPFQMEGSALLISVGNSSPMD